MPEWNTFFQASLSFLLVKYWNLFRSIIWDLKFCSIIFFVTHFQRFIHFHLFSYIFPFHKILLNRQVQDHFLSSAKNWTLVWVLFFIAKACIIRKCKQKSQSPLYLFSQFIAIKKGVSDYLKLPFLFLIYLSLLNQLLCPLTNCCFKLNYINSRCIINAVNSLCP